jgi:hypothetical protein
MAPQTSIAHHTRARLLSQLLHILRDVLLARASERDARGDDGHEDAQLVCALVNLVPPPVNVQRLLHNHVAAGLEQQRDAVGEAEHIQPLKRCVSVGACVRVSFLCPSQMQMRATCAAQHRTGLTSRPPSDTAASTMNGCPSHAPGGPVAHKAAPRCERMRGNRANRHTLHGKHIAPRRTAVRGHQLGAQLLHDAQAQVVLPRGRQAVRGGRVELGSREQPVQRHHLRGRERLGVAPRRHAVAALRKQPVRQRAIDAREL